MENVILLLVDDEEEFALTLSERLTLRGIRARVVFDGEEALREIEADPPQVVLLDVLMPRIGGMEVLRRIKLRHPRIQVILLTAQGSTKVGMEGMRLGAYDYLMKPVRIEELVEKIYHASGKA